MDESEMERLNWDIKVPEVKTYTVSEQIASVTRVIPNNFAAHHEVQVVTAAKKQGQQQNEATLTGTQMTTGDVTNKHISTGTNFVVIVPPTMSGSGPETVQLNMPVSANR